jgi:hypothetical protein
MTILLEAELFLVALWAAALDYCQAAWPPFSMHAQVVHVLQWTAATPSI